MPALRATAFWLFIYLAFSALVSSVLVALGRAPQFPVFETFAAAPVIWRVAFAISGVLAALTAFLLRRHTKISAVSGLVFLGLFVPSFQVVWGQLSLGIWIAVVATMLAIVVAIKTVKQVQLFNQADR